MTVKIGRFEMPKRVVKEDGTATGTYAKFIAEPLEPGYGRTIGNSLRRVLLSSLEGAAIASVKIEGAHHEFCAIPGVVGTGLFLGVGERVLVGAGVAVRELARG